MATQVQAQKKEKKVDTTEVDTRTPSGKTLKY